MKAILIVGNTGTGKTIYTQKLIKGKKNFVFDVNCEYENFNRFTEIAEMENFFLQIAETKNTIIVIEEATIFFNNRKYNDKLNSFLVGKRHSKNTFIFLFHSLRVIPLYIIDFTDYIILFKTNDHPDIIKKFENINNFQNFFNEVKTNKNPYFYSVISVR